jgi:hypothetical protein
VASKLNLTITGEYVPNIPPSPTPIPVRTTTTEAPATTTTTTEAPIVEAPIA